MLYVILRMTYVIMRNVIVGMEFRKTLARKVDAVLSQSMPEGKTLDVTSWQFPAHAYRSWVVWLDHYYWVNNLSGWRSSWIFRSGGGST